QRARDWMEPLVEQIVREPARINPIRDALEQTIGRATLLDKISLALTNFESFLMPRALEEPGLKMRAGKSIRPWLERLTIGFSRLESLIFLDLEHRYSDGPVHEILAILEAYEKRRL